MKSKSKVYIVYAVLVDGNWKIENMDKELTGYGSYVTVDCDWLIREDITKKFKKDCRYALVDKMMATFYEETSEEK